MYLRLSIDLPEDLTHLTMVRRVSRDVLTSCHVDTQDVDDIEALVGELATNAVRHARSAFGYRVEIELMNERAVVTVTDAGKGFSRTEVGAPGTTRPGIDGEDPERFGGWGLPLVEMLADHVEYLPREPHGTTIRAEKRLHTSREMLP